MQDVQLKINSIQNNIACGVFKDEQIQDKIDETKALEARIKRLKDQYKNLMAERDKSIVNTKRVSK